LWLVLPCLAHLAADFADPAFLLDLLLTISIGLRADAAGHSLPAHSGRIYRFPTLLLFITHIASH